MHRDEREARYRAHGWWADDTLTKVWYPPGVRSGEALLSAMSAHRGIASVRLDTNLIVRASTSNAPEK